MDDKLLGEICENLDLLQRAAFTKFFKDYNNFGAYRYLYSDFTGDIYDYISCYLQELLESRDYRFIKTFFSKVWELQNIHYSFWSYLYKVYIILKCYHCHKSEYATLLQLVSDVEYSDLHFSSHFASIGDKIWIVDKLLTYEDYGQISGFRSLFLKVVNEADEVFSEYEIAHIKAVFQKIDAIYSDIDFYRKKGQDLQEGSKKAISYLTDISFTQKNNSFIEHLFYRPFLLVGNRFTFVNDNAQLLGSNEILNNEILSRIPDSLVFYDYLNSDPEIQKKTNNQDAFIYYMNILLDSDTYYEVDQKLIRMERFFQEFQRAFNSFGIDSKRKSALREKFMELDSLEDKEVIDGEKMMFPSPNEVQNLVERPKTIIARMQYLYGVNLATSSRLDDLIKNYSDVSSIAELYQKIDNRSKIKKIGSVFKGWRKKI